MLQIFIPSRGRATMQKTLSGLPKKLADNAIIVVDNKEAKSYEEANKNNEIMALPKNVKGIASIRQYIMENSKNNLLCMLDDDLYFGARRTDGRILKTNPKETEAGFKVMEQWLKNDVIHCSLMPRFLWWNKPYSMVYREITRMMHVLAYDRDKVLGADCSFTKGVRKDFSMDDFHMTLQLITKGHKNRVSLRYCTSPSVSNSKGGASEWRTLNSHNNSAFTLNKIHGDCVSVKEKHGWEGMDGVRYDVVINWRRAAEIGGLKYDTNSGVKK